MLTLPETIKLFDSDAYAADFTASVLFAELIEKKKSSHWEIILDRTLFFPEEGGQTPDTETGSRPLYRDRLSGVRLISPTVSPTCRITRVSTSSPGLCTTASVMTMWAST